jgi:hypothetical protein
VAFEEIEVAVALKRFEQPSDGNWFSRNVGFRNVIDECMRRSQDTA